MPATSVAVMPPARYRCAACGNLTRFDVVTDRRTRAFHHFSVGGDLAVEEQEVLAEHVVEVCCRWCGHGRAIETLASSAAPPAETVSQPPATVSGTTDDGDPGNG